MQGGQIRILAQTGKSRSPAAPDIPTFAELGVRWHTTVRSELDRLGLDATFERSPQADRTSRSSHFATLHEDLNAVRVEDPTAIW